MATTRDVSRELVSGVTVTSLACAFCLFAWNGGSPKHLVQPRALRPQLEAAVEPAAADKPHPITAEHRALQHELQLVAAMNDALDREDGASLRGLVEQYAQLVPNDENALAAGYRQIADCLQAPSEAAREAAREYYTREKASTLRRYVRRICLERDDGSAMPRTGDRDSR